MSLGATKYIGRRIKRREDRRFLTGRTRYVDDVHLPGTVYAAFVRSPHAHAVIQSIHTEKARALPGVLAVLTSEEAVGLSKPIRCDSLFPEWKGSDFPILAWPRVRFVGEAIVAVVAVDRYVAEDAVDLVEIEYEPLPPVVDMELAVLPGSPLIHEEWGDNLFIDRGATIGDIDKAFAEADLVWKHTYKQHRYTGFPMEGRAVIADYNPAQDFLTVYSATQIPHLLRTGIADCLGMLESSIRVISHDVGGGFGIKGHLFPEEVALCLLSRKLGRPVKWIEDTREHLLACIHAREHTHHIEVAVKQDGTILGIKADILVNAGAYSVWPWTASMDAGMAFSLIPGPYRVPAYQARTRAVASNKCPMGPYRGVGRPAACFTIERALDDIARELGMDPVAIRLKNYIPDDAYPYTSITGMQYDSASMVKSMHKTVETIGYDKFREEQAKARSEGRYLGIGFACYIEQTAHGTQEFIKRGVPINFGYESVRVRMDPSGTVTVDSSLHSHGQGHETTFAQIVAERLAIPITDVRVHFGDTQSAPYGMGTFASRSAVLGGGAAWQAADAVKNALLKVAGNLLEVSPADLELVDGAIQVKGSPGKRMTVAEVARITYHRPEKVPAGMMPSNLESTISYDADPGTGAWATAVHACKLEVDPATGQVKLLKYDVVEDCGNMINPLIIDGQVMGGVAQGIGGALYEHLAYDESGQALSTTLMEYLLPSALEIPHIDVHHMVTPSPFTVGGFKGMGEGGAIAPGPCIANAVNDALSSLGVDVDRLPLSPANVLAMIAEAKAKSRQEV